MEINITGLNAIELLGVINKNPKGNVGVRDNQAFWVVSDTINQEKAQNPPFSGVPEALQKQNQGNPVANMRDYLFESFSG